MLKIRNLVVKYGLAEALKNINLQVENGTICAVLGNNGAGKSTLINAISGIHPPVKGSEISFSGKNIAGMKPHAIVKEGISQVPEGRHVFAKLSVIDNMRMGAYLRKDSQGIKDDICYCFDLFPILKERSTQIAGTLSGGEQQMLAIARGLMSKPKFLMLDEPSLGLAPVIVEKIYETLSEINKTGVTLLIVEQNANMALSVCDYAYTIVNGVNSISGTSEELLEDDSFINVYLGGK